VHKLKTVLTAMLTATLALSFSAADAGHWGKGPSIKQARKETVHATIVAVSTVSTILAKAAQHSAKRETCDNVDSEHQCTVEETNHPSGPTIENHRDPVIPPGAGGSLDEISPAERNPAGFLPHPSEPGYPRTPTPVID
jgi:hypothetical protein